jgi:hypothetical protein
VAAGGAGRRRVGAGRRRVGLCATGGRCWLGRPKIKNLRREPRSRALGEAAKNFKIKKLIEKKLKNRAAC